MQPPRACPCSLVITIVIAVVVVQNQWMKENNNNTFFLSLFILLFTFSIFWPVWLFAPFFFFAFIISCARQPLRSILFYSDARAHGPGRCGDEKDSFMRWFAFFPLFSSVIIIIIILKLCEFVCVWVRSVRCCTMYMWRRMEYLFLLWGIHYNNNAISIPNSYKMFVCMFGCIVWATRMTLAWDLAICECRWPGCQFDNARTFHIGTDIFRKEQFRL